MSITSKVLAGLNLLALFAYIFLASALFNYRTDWQYQNFLMERMLKGFPLNEEEVDSYGQPIAAQMGTLGDGTLKTLLGAGGGNPAGPTLLDEAKAVKSEVEPKLGAAGTREDFEKFLTPLSNSFAERAALIRLGGPPAGEETAAERVTALIAAAVDGKRKGKSLSPEEQREAIGRFLWAAQGLKAGAGSPTQVNRLVALVGPSIAINTITQSIRNVEEMTRQVNAVRVLEQSNFLKEHDSLVQEIRSLDMQLQRKVDEFNAVKQKSMEQEASRMVLEANRDDLQKQLVDKRAKAVELMNALMLQGKSLYDNRIKVLEAIKTMQQTESKIRQLEGLKPISQPSPSVGQ